MFTSLHAVPTIWLLQKPYYLPRLFSALQMESVHVSGRTMIVWIVREMNRKICSLLFTLSPLSDCCKSLTIYPGCLVRYKWSQYTFLVGQWSYCCSECTPKRLGAIFEECVIPLSYRAGHVQTADSSLLSASAFSLPSLCIERAKWMASQVRS